MACVISSDFLLKHHPAVVKLTDGDKGNNLGGYYHEETRRK